MKHSIKIQRALLVMGLAFLVMVSHVEIGIKLSFRDTVTDNIFSSFFSPVKVLPGYTVMDKTVRSK